MLSTANIYTAAEVLEIELWLADRPDFYHPNAMSFGNNPTDVMKVSHITGLIMTMGNSETGFQHIRDRHDFHFGKSYWRESTNKEGGTIKKLQNQTRFNPDSIPIIDYMAVADSLYKTKKLISGDSDTEQFDVYFGTHLYRTGVVDEYKLVLYKNSKVIHTLYPQKKTYNPKRVKNFEFVRGAVTGTHDYAKGIFEIKVPYLNAENITKYTLKVRKYQKEKIEDCIVIIHDDSGSEKGFVGIGQRPLLSFEPGQIELLKWQHFDLIGFEEQIKNIHNQTSDT